MCAQPVRSVLLVAPKRDSTRDECEDAGAMAPESGRFAVADGASESAHAGLWASLLADAFVQGADDWPDWLDAVRAGWARAIERPADEGPVPWFLEGRDERGAFATFLGLKLDAEQWQALAVGDACLFLVRDGRHHLSFPIECSSQFGNTPLLVGSRAAQAVASLRGVPRTGGEVQAGDRFWLMTDALARWYLERIEAGEKPWLLVEQLCEGNEEQFTDWVTFSRSTKRLRNDDTTLLGVLL
jgi:hypothetical protein